MDACDPLLDGCRIDLAGLRLVGSWLHHVIFSSCRVSVLRRATLMVLLAQPRQSAQCDRISLWRPCVLLQDVCMIGHAGLWLVGSWLSLSCYPSSWGFCPRMRAALTCSVLSQVTCTFESNIFAWVPCVQLELCKAHHGVLRPVGSWRFPSCYPSSCRASAY